MEDMPAAMLAGKLKQPHVYTETLIRDSSNFSKEGWTDKMNIEGS